MKTWNTEGVPRTGGDVPAVEIGCLAFVCIVLALFGESPEKAANVSYVKRAAELCPAIAPRMNELLADSRVTNDEAGIVETLQKQARAAPGGLTHCRID
jgi:hypothetical protein